MFPRMNGSSRQEPLTSVGATVEYSTHAGLDISLTSKLLMRLIPFWTFNSCPDFLFVGMCRRENENWPIHLPKFDPKLDPYIDQKSKNCHDFAENCAKFVLNFLKIFENFAKIGYGRRKKIHWFTQIKVWQGSFIYQRGENGTLFRSTSPIPRAYPYSKWRIFARK